MEEGALPLYYREISYPGDTLYYTLHEGFLQGVAGDPVPYTTRTDSLLSVLLLMSFAILVVSVAQSKRFIVRQVKNIFYPSYNDSNISETSAEVRFQIFLVLLSCLLLSISVYQYIIRYVADTFVFDSDLQIMLLFFAIFAAYHLAKTALYQTVNRLFFSKQKSRQWARTYLFINASEGMLLFPVTLLLIYFNLSAVKSLHLFGFILFFAKILTFYKAYDIFFKQNGGFLQSFLYFCTLEIVPLLNLTGGLLILIDNLIYNF